MPTGSTSRNIDMFYWQHRSDWSDFQSYDCSASAPSLSLSGTTLTVTPMSLTGSKSGKSSGSGTSYVATSVYYVGKID